MNSLDRYRDLLEEICVNRKKLNDSRSEYNEEVAKLKNWYKIIDEELYKERINLIEEEHLLGRELLNINLGAFIHEISKALNILDSKLYPSIMIECNGDDNNNLNKLLNGNEVDLKGSFNILLNNFTGSFLFTSYIRIKKTDNMIKPQLVKLYDVNHSYDNFYVDLYNINVDLDIRNLYYFLSEVFDFDTIKNIIINSCIKNDGKKLIYERGL